MDASPTSADHFDDIVTPLKRNRACLQCRKRKVKCDALKPVCSPCLRTHAHVVRSAQRNLTPVPELCCTFVEGDETGRDSSDEVNDIRSIHDSKGSIEGTGSSRMGMRIRHRKKAGGKRPINSNIRKAAISRVGERLKENEIRKVEKKEMLLPRNGMLSIRLSST